MSRLENTRCVACWRRATPGTKCPCGASDARRVDAGGRAAAVGLLGLVDDGSSFSELVARVFPGILHRPAEPAPGAGEPWSWRGESSAGAVWLWRARLDELPPPSGARPCTEPQASRLRALGATDVLVVELGPPERSTARHAFRGALPAGAGVVEDADVFAAVCALLDEIRHAPKHLVLLGGGRPGQVPSNLSQRAGRIAWATSRPEALALAVRLANTGAPRASRVAVARDRIEVDELGGVAAGEFLSHLHAASAHRAAWRRGAPPPALVTFAEVAPRGRFQRGVRLVGCRPSHESLSWGLFHARRGIAPAPGDGVPSWTARVRSGFWMRSLPLLPVWRREAGAKPPAAVTLLGVGGDTVAGERRLDELLEGDDAWRARPTILLRHRYTSERLWRAAQEVLAGAPTFAVPDGALAPWREPVTLLAPVLRALSLLDGVGT
jgi:hypothetical protein